MSSVDNRIVRMEFDASKFTGAATAALSMLSKLKTSLDTFSAASGLTNAFDNISGADLAPLSNGIDTATSKFSILQQAAAVALGNIATKAIEAGASLVKSFAIEPVTQGFEEYELKMNSIQTMMMSTGEPLERVNQKLDELNTYADKTIYSFSDMTSNIGKFTNAGVGLDESVAAIQGVANVAALSGANASEASHAMYNFGQALSSGSVRLQDWKSIEVANMATVEFKNELIKTALEMGTLVQEGDKYVSTTTDLNGHVSDAFDAVSMFNDSLSAQWMTTDVLTKTLNRYADETTDIGKKAFQAATQVKTFSQLIDTTKESIGSGWATSYELVVGNFEEARDLWTSVSNVIGDFVGKQANARNEMLKTWKELGGRNDAIKALSNVFGALGKVMKTVGDAWSEVFPPMTGEKLASLTKKFLEFTEKLKISDSTADKLKSTFKGLFSILDIGKNAILALVGSAGNLLKPFSSLGSKVLDLTSNFGKYVSGLRDSIVETKSFEKVFESLGNIGSKIGDKIKSAFEAIKSGFSSFKESVSELGIFESIEKEFEKFSKKVSDKGFADGIFDSLSKVFDKDKIVDATSAFSEKVGAAFDKITAFIKDVLNSDSLTSLIHAGMFTKFLDSILEFSEGFTSPIEMLGEVGKSVKKTVKSIGETFESFQNQVDGKSIREIAIAIGILATALYALASLSLGDIGKGLVTIGTLMGELVIAIQKLDSIQGVDSLKSVANTFLKIASSVDILVLAIRGLKDLNMEEIARGIVAIGAILGELGVFLRATSGLKMGTFKITSFLALSGVVKILAEIAKDLGQVDTEVLINGLASVGIILMELAAFNITTANSKLGLFKAAAFAALAGVIKILSEIAKDLGSFPEEVLIRGFTAIGAVLAEIAIFNIATANSKLSLFKAAAFIGLAECVKILSEIAKDLGVMKDDDLIDGITAIGAVLTEIGLFSYAMSGVSGIIKTALALGIMSGSMELLADSLTKFSSIKPKELGVGLTAMAGSLIILGTAASLLSAPGIFTAALAMGVMAGSMALMAPALKAMGSLSLKQLGIALAGLAAGLIVLGVAGVALKPAIPVMLSIAAVLGAFGLAVGGVAAVIIAFTASDALNSFGKLWGGLSNAVKGALDAIGGVGSAIGSLANQIEMASLGEIIMGVLKGAIMLIPTLVTELLNGLTMLAQGIIEFAPTAGMALVVVITTLCSVLVSAIPTVASAAMQLILGIANAFIEYGPQIIQALVTILVLLADIIGTYAPVIVNAAVVLIVNLINGLANAIRDNSEIILGAIRNLLSAAIELILECLAQIASLIPVVGDDIANALDGVQDAVREKLAPETMKDITVQAGTGLGDGFGETMDYVKGQAGMLATTAKTELETTSDGTFDLGQLRGTEWGDGLGSVLDYANQNGIDLTDSGIEGLLYNMQEYGTTGTEDGQLFATDLGNEADNANNAGTEVTNSALEGLQSNSTEYGTTGTNDGTLFSTDLSNQSGNARSAGTTIAVAAVEGAGSQTEGFGVAADNAGGTFCSRLSSWASSAGTAAANMASAAKAAAMAALEEHSPSKVFKWIADMAGEGMVIGFNDKEEDVSRASAHMAKESIGTMIGAIATAMENIDEMDYEPTITPVLDLSNIENDASKIQSLLGNTAANVNASIQANSLNLQNGSNFSRLAGSLKADNSDTIEAIQSLRTDIANLATAVTGMQIILDSGVLVGQTSAQMDNAIGMRQIYAERGM